jgi:Flp pilus assembly protein TadG
VYFSIREANRRQGRRRGGSAAELALCAPVLLFILLIAVDFCRLFYAYNIVTNAARNGALWASDPLANGTVTPSQSPYPTLLAAASADASNLNPALTNANVTPTTGTDGHGNATAVVTVSYQFNLITSYLGLSNIDLSRQVSMRVAPATPN